VPKVPGVLVAGAVAVAATALVFAVVRWQASKAIVAAGFRFDPGSFALPGGAWPLVLQKIGP
jgi:hypothetical protein